MRRDGETRESIEIREEMGFSGPCLLVTQLGNRKYHLHSLFDAASWVANRHGKSAYAFILPGTCWCSLKLCQWLPVAPGRSPDCLASSIVALHQLYPLPPFPSLVSCHASLVYLLFWPLLEHTAPVHTLLLMHRQRLPAMPFLVS